MILGIVTDELEAILSVAVHGAGEGNVTVGAVLDTGFSGLLTLPSEAIDALGLTWVGREEGILADGSSQFFDVYRGEVEWDGRRRVVDVQATQAEPLLGMAMLLGSEVKLKVIPGGSVTIAPIE